MLFFYLQKYKHVQQTNLEEPYQVHTEVRLCEKVYIKKKYWRGHPDLNQGPLDLQSNALPLSYTPAPCICRS